MRNLVCFVLLLGFGVRAAAAVVDFEDVVPTYGLGVLGPCFGAAGPCSDVLVSGDYQFGSPDNGVTDNGNLVADPWFFNNGVQALSLIHI